ncbi:hypothetical protein RF55_19752 [Lasius niger]|uniref:DUF4817 domain-containing protein n=1 Tax=Lasius niger TaxID=67767 RepID=A0A0J7JZQ2_LASNI|nr:hypothetical protein RF55_19752 [Lasius niger]
MNRYTNAEMTDMHFVYGLANGNSLQAKRLYSEQFPNRRIPDRKTFVNIHQRFHDTGAFKSNGGSGRPMTIRTVELEENVLNMVEEDPSTFTRKIAEDLNIKEIPLATRNVIWFMHDGAPAHFSVVACEFLNATYPDHWIGRGGPHPWPARSPDLNPIDFFLWGYLKSLVYNTPVENEEDLRNRIVDG